MHILAFPLARITIFFLIGIVFSFYGNCRPLYTFLATAFLFSALCLFTFFFKNHYKQHYFAWTVYLLAFSIGITTQIIHTSQFDNRNYSHSVTEEPQQLFLTLREKLKGNHNNDRFIAQVNAIDGKSATGKLLVNFRKNNPEVKLAIGSRIWIDATIILNKNPLNPYQFDYGKYLNNKSIPAQIYADSKDLKISTKSAKTSWYYADCLRSKIIRNLSNAGFRLDELQVVNALILGQQQEISTEILRDYQYAGAVHILSVSGLHVGFILIFLNFLLKPLPKSRSGNLTKMIIIILSLWGFAVIAGLSPSVVRSATMFSFMAWGMYLRRSSNMYHTLLVSVLMILIFEPSFLFDVGFQLSYTALFFILWLQPILSDIWNPKNVILKYFWDILTVSFAAQIGTFPLSVYYFHQFPGLFFVTNLVIIPMLSIIMVLGVVVMLLSVAGIVPLLLAKSLEWFVWLMNGIINKIAALETFVLRDIPLNIQVMIGLYLFIFAFICWYKSPSFFRMFFLASACLLLQAAFYFSHWIPRSQSEFIVFNARKNSIIIERHGENALLYSSEKLAESKFKNQINSYLMAHAASITKTKPMRNTFFFDGRKVLLIDSASAYIPTSKPHLVILTQSPKINLDRLISDLNPTIIVADASNFKTYLQKWEQTCMKRKIPFHQTGKEGFFAIRKTN